MLMEAMRYLRELADDARSTEDLKIDRLPKNRVWLATKDGDVREMVLPEPPLLARACDLTTLVAAVAAGVNDPDASIHPEFWFSERLVVGFQDHGGIPDRVELPLTKTSRWGRLESLAASAFGQKEFLRLLRLELGNAVPAGVVDVLRKVLFKAHQEAQGQIGHNKASVGKTLQVELQTQEKLPEEVNLYLQVFNEVDYFATVLCALEIDIEAQRFQLVPMPGELDLGVKAALAYVRSILESLRGEEKWPVYYGCPFHAGFKV